MTKCGFRTVLFLTVNLWLSSLGVVAHADSTCVVNDPTGTPLNARTAPFGRILTTLQNGVSVEIIDRTTDRYGKPWVYIADKENRPLGWVFLEYIACSTTPQMLIAERMCFERHYDAVHLSKHPDQLVTSMTLALIPGGPIASENPTMNEGIVRSPLDFKIAVTKRGDNNLYVQEGFGKISDGKYNGVVECDGGGFILQKEPSGVLVSIGLGPGSNEGIQMAVLPGPCGEGDQNNSTVDLKKGKDDDTFPFAHRVD
jgi:hypothetical protein